MDTLTTLTTDSNVCLDKNSRIRILQCPPHKYAFSAHTQVDELTCSFLINSLSVNWNLLNNVDLQKSAYHPRTKLADPGLRETDYMIHIKTTLLTSSDQMLVNLILVHTKSIIAFSTRWVSTAVKNLTSR